MDSQNLMEPVQGYPFLGVEAIAMEFDKVGIRAAIHLDAEGNEAVVVGRK